MYDFCSCGLVVSSPSAPLALMPPPPSGVCQPIAMSRSQMQLHLTDLQQHTVELRKQLTQLRQLQVCAFCAFVFSQIFFFFAVYLILYYFN